MKNAEDKVQAILTEIAESFRKDLEEFKTKQLTHYIGVAKKQDNVIGVPDGREGADFRSDFWGTFEDMCIRDRRRYGFFTDRYGRGMEFFRFVDYDLAMVRIKGKAHDYASAVIADFREKVSGKLFAIISAKVGQVESINGGGHISRNTIRFEFTDGSKFTTLCQIVSVWNRKGTAFQRYPLTFHDVYVAGKKMTTPSEAKMKKEFLGVEIKTGPVVHMRGRFNARWIGEKKVGLCVGSAMGAQRFFGMTTENPEEVTCKKCLKHINR